MKRPRFPITVESKLRAARIYRTASMKGRKRYPEYTVVWYEGDIRRRQKFADLAKAERRANQVVATIAHEDERAIRLPDQERVAYVRARDALSGLGLSVDTAAVQFREAQRILGDVSLVEAARYYAAHHVRNLPPKTVEEVFREMLQAKREEGLSGRYVGDLESRCAMFSQSFQCRLAAVTGSQIRDWIQSLNVANRTRNNFRNATQTLFAFAKSRKYLPPDWDELGEVPMWKTREETVEVFTPDDIATLLSRADAKLVPFLAIGAFAGLRSAELGRLDWSKVNLLAGHITVDASIAKTSSRRIVPITENLKAWLSPHTKRHGRVCPYAFVTGELMKLSRRCKVAWRHNGLRHSFCSYRLATVKSAPQVALEAGNSPAMIFKHYRQLVTEAEGAAWFGVMPAGVGNLLSLPAAAPVTGQPGLPAEASQG